MKYTRFSRNPKLARIMTEFGWVKELNEGVNRIYDEMQSFFLHAPKYSEPNNQAVLLVLENSITSRNVRVIDQLSNLLSENWGHLSEEQQVILRYMYCREKSKVRDMAQVLGKGLAHTRNVLKELVRLNLVEWKGTSTRDPHQYYVIKNK